MKIRYVLVLFVAVSLSMLSCKKEVEKVAVQKEVAVAKMETVSLNISGMTCEIGCAKTIQSKLSKKEGVAFAKVIFTDSIAKVKFDANQISSEELITFIDGIAGGDLYKASVAQAKE